MSDALINGLAGAGGEISKLVLKLVSCSGYNNEAIRRWTTHRKLGYDLIDCDIIFVPIHAGIHWTLAVINNRECKFMYLDSLNGVNHMVVKQEGWRRLYGGLAPSVAGTAASQGVYYYFYQVFRNQAEVAARERRKKGLGDGSVGMLSSLLVAAFAG